MRIPIEHFSTTPVFALSPIGPIESQSKRIELDNSLTQTSNARKVSLPNGYPIASSVGSAPSSPKSSPKSSQENLGQMSSQNSNQQPMSLLPTISGMVVGANQPTSLPPFMLNSNNKYATLPTK